MRQLSGFAAKKRKEIKNAKYDNEILPGRIAPKWKPVVFEQFGLWGFSAERLLNTLLLKSKDKEGKNNSADFKTCWRRRFCYTAETKCSCDDEKTEHCSRWFHFR